jgi:thiamine biosynthesis lipoprotein
MKKRLYINGAAILLFAAIMAACCSHEKKPVSVQTYMMGTIVEISLYEYEGNGRKLLDGCIELCAEYEKVFSRTMEGSELYNLNAEMAKYGEGEVSDELRALIESSLYYSRISEGAFDITIGSVTDLWDFSSASGHIPEEAEIAEAIKLVSYERVIVDGSKVKAPVGTVFDLGAVAKGYIGDRLKEYLVEKGVAGAIINLGGNVLCIGGAGKGKPFTIGIKKPFEKNGEISAFLKIKDLSAVTSGPYERYFVKNDRLYHHILDTKTGYPVETELRSVTIISDKSELCDALSTACFAMGLEKAKKLIESFEDVYAVFIDDEGMITLSEGFSEAIEINVS